MDRNEIEEAVQVFLKSARGDERPLRSLADYLLVLQAQGWSQNDLREVQSRAMAELKNVGRPPAAD